MELRSVVKTKKGAIEEVYGLLRVLFIIAIFAGLSLMILAKFQNKSYDSTSGSVTNETLTTVTETGEDFAVVDYRDVACTVTLVHNASNGAVIGSGNYTATNCNLASADAEFNNTNWNVTYTYVYNADTVASSGMNTSIATIKDDIIGWLGIVAIAIIGFALMRYFGLGMGGKGAK